MSARHFSLRQIEANRLVSASDSRDVRSQGNRGSFLAEILCGGQWPETSLAVASRFELPVTSPAPLKSPQYRALLRLWW